MHTPATVEGTLRDYVRAWSARDPAARASLVESCFAEQGRLVTGGRQLRGRAALAELMAEFHARTSVKEVRFGSAVDIQGTLFRLRGIVEFWDGAVAENFDAGEVDADGRIALLLTFAGPLGETARAD
jgi:hypothetical protein